MQKTVTFRLSQEIRDVIYNRDWLNGIFVRTSLPTEFFPFETSRCISLGFQGCFLGLYVTSRKMSNQSWDSWTRRLPTLENPANVPKQLGLLHTPLKCIIQTMGLIKTTNTDTRSLLTEFNSQPVSLFNKIGDLGINTIEWTRIMVWVCASTCFSFTKLCNNG